MGSTFSTEKLEEDLGEYIIDTHTYTEIVKGFCDKEPEWTLQRRSEVVMMQKEVLGEVLKNTLRGLKNLQHFLDAVEKLAVTSLSVFRHKTLMPEGVSNKNMCSVISAARMVSPLLIHFKRDAGEFFRPSPSNVEVLVCELDKYINITQLICERMNVLSEEVTPKCKLMCGLFTGNHRWENGKLSLKFIRRKSKGQKLYNQLNQLIKIRKDESFRMTFIFGPKAQDFINLFSERRSRIFQFLSDIEEAAVQLDNMKKGSDISAVAGSSVGLAGGVCAIAGLALAPFTAGTSLALTYAGAGLGITSGVNSLVTGVTELAVNSYQRNTANETFARFMEDIQDILKLMAVVGTTEDLCEVIMEHEVENTAACIMSVAEDIDDFAKVTSRSRRTEKVIRGTAKIGLKKSKAAKKIPKISAAGKMAKKPLSKAAKIGTVALSALFVGLDAYFLYEDVQNLKKGSKSTDAQLIRSRSALWRSEVKAWEKIHNHLTEGISEYDKNLEVLEQPFHLK